METSQRGINLIKRHEGVILHSYLCPANKLTIGFGHTGSDVKKGMIITEEEAENLLKKDLKKIEGKLNFSLEHDNITLLIRINLTHVSALFLILVFPLLFFLLCTKN